VLIVQRNPSSSCPRGNNFLFPGLRPCPLRQQKLLTSGQSDLLHAVVLCVGRSVKRLPLPRCLPGSAPAGGFPHVALANRLGHARYSLDLASPSGRSSRSSPSRCSARARAGKPQPRPDIVWEGAGRELWARSLGVQVSKLLRG